MKSLTCISSRSRGTCCAVILERLAENCRGRTTAIICTRTNAPKYILESHRLHFGSICDQNGRNFEPCIHWFSRAVFISLKLSILICKTLVHQRAVSVERYCKVCVEEGVWRSRMTGMEACVSANMKSSLNHQNA